MFRTTSYALTICIKYIIINSGFSTKPYSNTINRRFNTMDQKFFTDGTNIFTLVCGDGDVPGELNEINAGTTDAAAEKHVPVYEVSEGVCTVTVGSVAHPMTPEHLISWIVVKTNKGTYIKYLTAENAPSAKFILEDDETVESVYEYCNLHKLWKA